MTETPANVTDADVQALAAWVEHALTVIERQRSIRTTPCSLSDINHHVIANYYWPHQNVEEALWCAFLATHIGTSSAGAYRHCAAEFYCAYTDESTWTWARVSGDLDGFRTWLYSAAATIASRLRFGNHRKNESKQPADLFKVVETYCQWVRRHGGRESLQAVAFSSRDNSPTSRFEALFVRFQEVHRIGRLAAFDHLTMLANYGILDIEPGSTYLEDATGPLEGARMLWPRKSDEVLRKRADKMAVALGVPYQAIEDALCNWQKDKPCFIDPESACG